MQCTLHEQTIAERQCECLIQVHVLLQHMIECDWHVFLALGNELDIGANFFLPAFLAASTKCNVPCMTMLSVFVSERNFCLCIGSRLTM